MAKTINVTIWNEYRHEKSDENVAKLYPNGLHAAIGEFLSKNDDMKITLAALDDPDQGLPDEVLNNTDVLLWWGHMNHGEVKDDLVERIRQRVYVGGMGFIALHSAHHSKPFRAIVGTTGNLLWGDNQKEIIWNIMPSHPIAAGIPSHFEKRSFTQSPSRFRSPTHISSRDGMSTDMCSAPDAPSSAARDVCSTSSPVMRPARRSTTQTYSA